MRRLVCLISSCALLGAAGPALAQAAAPQSRPERATYVTKAEVETVEKAIPNGDRNVKVVDIGHENFAVGVVHRGKTVDGKAVERGTPSTAARLGTCGKQLAHAPEGGRPGGITHDSQAEGYYITSGGGTMFTDGYIVNGTHLDLADLNGPTCLGVAYDVKVRAVKEGDIVIIPAGVVHGWLDIPDHVDYLSFRPSPGVLKGGWVSPALRDAPQEAGQR